MDLYLQLPICFHGLTGTNLFFRKFYVILGVVIVVKHFSLSAHYTDVSWLSAVLHDNEETLISTGFLCNKAVPSVDLSHLAIFMATLVINFIISVVVLPLLIYPEGVGSRFVWNVGYGITENSSKLLLFYFEILQSLYFSKRLSNVKMA